MRSQSALKPRTTPIIPAKKFENSPERLLALSTNLSATTHDRTNRSSILYTSRKFEKEKEIECPKTLEASHERIILLTCELERISTLNYDLVRENEILRLGAFRTTREKDLETKLGVVIAENEKLNQLIDNYGEDTGIADERDKITPKRQYETQPLQQSTITLPISTQRVLEDKYSTRFPVGVPLEDLSGMDRERLEHHIEVLTIDNDRLKAKLTDTLSYTLQLIDENKKLKGAVPKDTPRENSFKTRDVSKSLAVTPERRADPTSDPISDDYAFFGAAQEKDKRTGRPLLASNDRYAKSRNESPDNENERSMLQLQEAETVERLSTTLAEVEKLNYKIKELVDLKQKTDQQLFEKCNEVQVLRNELSNAQKEKDNSPKVDIEPLQREIVQLRSEK
jgi:hypothetical protein